MSQPQEGRRNNPHLASARRNDPSCLKSGVCPLSVLRVSGRCLDGAWWVSGGCPVGVCKVSGGCFKT